MRSYLFHSPEDLGSIHKMKFQWLDLTTNEGCSGMSCDIITKYYTNTYDKANR